jgi:hypothetical protein
MKKQNNKNLLSRDTFLLKQFLLKFLSKIPLLTPMLNASGIVQCLDHLLRIDAVKSSLRVEQWCQEADIFAAKQTKNGQQNTVGPGHRHLTI